jgi:hypothetical protein
LKHQQTYVYNKSKRKQKLVEYNSMAIYPLQRVFYPQNRHCTPKISICRGTKLRKKQQLYSQFQNSVGTLKISCCHSKMLSGKTTYTKTNQKMCLIWPCSRHSLTTNLISPKINDWFLEQIENRFLSINKKDI